MPSFRKQLPNCCSLLMRGDHVVFAESILETVSVLAVKHGYPAGLLPEILEDCIVFLGEHPEVPAWRPLKASSDSMSFFLVRALRALQSSMMYRVGSPWKT